MNNVIIIGKTEMSDVDLIIHILAMLGDDYEVAVSSLEDRLASTTQPLEVEEVWEKIIMRHDIIKQHEKKMWKKRPIQISGSSLRARSGRVANMVIQVEIENVLSSRNKKVNRASRILIISQASVIAMGSGGIREKTAKA